DRLELHQHQVADHVLGQVGVLAQRKGDVLERGEVGEQGAELVEHAHASPQAIEPVAVETMHVLAVEHDRALLRAQLAADQPQDGRLARAGASDQRDDLSALETHRDVVQDDALAVSETDPVQREELWHRGVAVRGLVFRRTRDSKPGRRPGAAAPGERASRHILAPRSQPPAVTPERLLDRAREVLRIEAEAVARLAERIDASFADACRMILSCTGRVVVSGIGKSGHVARKIAATLASTGTPAFFVHPAEASHGDLGMVTRDDVFVALSNSGSTDELLTIVPVVKRQGARLIAITGDRESPLARLADVHLDAAVDREACPLNLAPTASTTATLALGDALAVALLDARGFGPMDFALSHPGGALGRR